MNPETTTQEMRLPQLQSWLISFGLHGFLLLGFLSLFHQPLLVLPTEPFHWNVSLVQSTQTAAEPVQNVTVSVPIAPKPTARPPMPPRTVRTTRYAASSIEPRTLFEPKTDTPGTSAPMPDSHPPLPSPSNADTSLIANGSTAAQVPENESPEQPAEKQIASSTEAPPQLERTAAAAPPDESTRQTDRTEQASLPATASDTPAVSAIRPDYGWLQQAIFRRLEELKRSSHPFIDQSQPLRVLVRAVVSREGFLLDFAVAKSSGLGRIDQEALALVQQAFPMQLDRALDREQIVLRIPITYSRE